MKCYFCLDKLENLYCLKCKAKHYIKLDGKLYWIKFQLVEDEWKIRATLDLDIQFNQTLINDFSESGLIILSGFPITPQNINEKLPLYLTFL